MTYQYLDLEQVEEFKWQAAGDYPTIKFSDRHISSGWTNLRFKYQTDLGNMRNPVFSFEVYGVKTRVRLNRGNDGNIDHVINIPKGASNLSIELLGISEVFILTKPEFRIISKFTAKRLIFKGTWSKSRNEGFSAWKSTLYRGLTYAKKYGIRGLRVRLVQAYHHGAGSELFEGKRQSTYTDFQTNWSLTSEDIRKIGERIEDFSYLPLISIVMPVYDPEKEWLEEAIDSVIGQVYSNWELCIADDNSTRSYVREILNKYKSRESRIKVIERSVNGHISAASNTALELANGDWITFLDHDDVLHPAALFSISNCLQQNPDLKLIYTDEDKIDQQGLCYEPHFKPDYNHALLLSVNYFNHLVAIKNILIQEIGGFRLGLEGAQDYDLFLRCIEKISPQEIFHIPFPLYSWRSTKGSTALAPDSKEYAEKAGIQALVDHYERIGMKVSVSQGLVPTTYRTKRISPKLNSLVSVIIPTRNGGKYLERCLSSFFEFTKYPNFEVIILDNGSTDPATLKLLAGYKERGLVRIIDSPGAFNYSALNNRGVEASNGELICLLNDDIEVTTEGWLVEMASQLVDPGVGVVGAKLLYPDRSVQHAGIVTGIGGIAGHGHKHASIKDDGYFHRLRVVHEVGAVTGACLLTRKELWLKLGGLDEEFLKVAFNDVDYCLRVRSSGQSVLWTPYAELIHHESVTRGLDTSKEKIERAQIETQTMKDRWGESLLWDPAYNPNLSLDTEGFELSDRPRVSPPWRNSRTGII